MKKLFIVYLLFITTISLQAQQITIVIDNATLHIGDGSVIEKGTVIFKNGKIEYAGPQKDHGFDDNTASIIDGTGKHVYPGIIRARWLQSNRSA